MRRRGTEDVHTFVVATGSEICDGTSTPLSLAGGKGNLFLRNHGRGGCGGRKIRDIHHQMGVEVHAGRKLFEFSSAIATLATLA